jgi:regulator of protease activity HflC (stomatin/prohibitin superfamily)
VGEPSITAASIFGVWVLVNIPFALFYITPASIGLETTIGGVTTGTVYQPGYHWSKPWTVVYEGTVTTPISFEVNTQVITQENQTVNLSAFSIVQITPDAVPDLFRIGLIEWGGDLNILAGIRLSELMKNAVKRGLYTYGQGKPLNDIRAETEKLAPVIQDELNKSLEQYGLGAPIKVTKAQVTGVSEQVRFVVKER